MDFNSIITKSTLDLLPFGIYWTDENKRAIGCNMAHETTTGISCSQTKGKNAYEFAEMLGWEYSIPNLVDSYISNTLSDKKSYNYFIPVTLSDKKKHVQSIWTLPIITDDTVKMIGISIDIELITVPRKSTSDIFSSINNISDTIQILTQLAPKQQGTKNRVKLSNRELACIKLLKEGLSSKQIALILNISKRTVEQYMDTAKTKLSCKNSVELIYKCFKSGILS